MALDIEGILKAVAAVSAPVAALAGVGSRRRRLRAEVRENLSLVEALEKHEVIRDHTPALGWLQGKIALDVARLAGFPLGAPKKPVPKGAVATAALLGVISSAWTYLIDRNGFVWYSVFPATVAFLMFISVLGMFTNREIPPDQESELPEGATPIRTDTTAEQVMAAVAVAGDGVDERFSTGGQADVALAFVRAMRQGQYEDAIVLADDNWLLCRVQSWLWNNQTQYGSDTDELDRLSKTMLSERAESEVWRDFVEIERRAFIEAWHALDPDQLGAASRRRRLAREYDLVVLVPLGNTGGYFVTSATLLPNALTFVLRRSWTSWLISSHIGAAPPEPGWPPAWWSVNDPGIVDLP